MMLFPLVSFGQFDEAISRVDENYSSLNLNLNEFKYIIINDVSTKTPLIKNSNNIILRKFLVKALEKRGFNIIDSYKIERNKATFPEDFKENRNIGLYLNLEVEQAPLKKEKSTISLLDFNNKLLYKREEKVKLLKSGWQIILDDDFKDYKKSSLY